MHSPTTGLQLRIRPSLENWTEPVQVARGRPRHRRAVQRRPTSWMLEAAAVGARIRGRMPACPRPGSRRSSTSGAGPAPQGAQTPGSMRGTWPHHSPSPRPARPRAACRPPWRAPGPFCGTYPSSTGRRGWPPRTRFRTVRTARFLCGSRRPWRCGGPSRRACGRHGRRAFRGLQGTSACTRASASAFPRRGRGASSTRGACAGSRLPGMPCRRRGTWRSAFGRAAAAGAGTMATRQRRPGRQMRPQWRPCGGARSPSFGTGRSSTGKIGWACQTPGRTPYTACDASGRPRCLPFFRISCSSSAGRLGAA